MNTQAQFRLLAILLVSMTGNIATAEEHEQHTATLNTSRIELHHYTAIFFLTRHPQVISENCYPIFTFQMTHTNRDNGVLFFAS